MDADDHMYEDRIEKIVETFRAHQPDAVLHGITGANCTSDPAFFVDANAFLRNYDGGTEFPEIEGMPCLAYGHVSVTRDVFKDYKQEIAPGREDLDYLLRLLKNEKSIVGTGRALAHYHIEGSAGLSKDGR